MAEAPDASDGGGGGGFAVETRQGGGGGGSSWVKPGAGQPSIGIATDGRPPAVTISYTADPCAMPVASSGAPGDDTLNGTNGNDVICGLGGLGGLGGDDRIAGGPGAGAADQARVDSLDTTSGCESTIVA